MRYYEEKDMDRVKNIVARAKYEHDKSLQLARNMAKAIKDPAKAERRMSAALEVGAFGYGAAANTYIAIAGIFADRKNKLAY